MNNTMIFVLYRKNVVEQALHWLISNNKYYQANQVHINQQVLAQLPNDGRLNGLRSVMIEDTIQVVKRR